MHVGKPIIGFGKRFRHPVGGLDVVDLAEVVADAEPRHHAPGVGCIGVGEHQLAAGQPTKRRLQRLARCDRREIDVVHVVEKGCGVHIVLEHEAAQSGAVLAEVALLQLVGLLPINVEGGGNVVADALAHLVEEVRTRRIEGVVEVEYPGVDVSEVGGARCRARAVGQLHWPLEPSAPHLVAVDPSRAAEVGLEKIGAVQPSAGEVGTAQVGAEEAGAAEIGAFERGAGEIRLGEVGAD